MTAPLRPASTDTPGARLSLRALSHLPGEVRRPSYDPSRLPMGVLHLGVGAFHRAHQALYTEAALASRFGPWGIAGVSFRSPVMREKLKPQDFLYSVSEVCQSGERRIIAGALRDVIFDAAQAAALVAAAHIKLATLTITEKGYCLDASRKSLDLAHPEIVADLASPSHPRSAIGMLAGGLCKRFASGGAPITVLSCDNLSGNGNALRQAVLEFAGRLDREAQVWIEREVAFPCTMVDRIVPAATDDLIARTAAALGVHDAAPVASEPFAQWVIEDNFSSPRPHWEAGGALFVAGVRPFEELKLRLLNASHSLLAYLGAVCSDEFVWQFMERPGVPALVTALMQEAAPSIALPHGFDLQNYQTQLLARFGNKALHHACLQIAIDGSQKLPQRLIPPLEANLKAGRPIRMGCLAIAAWMRFILGCSEKGEALSLQDPLAGCLKTRLNRAGGALEDVVLGLMSVSAIFPEILSKSELVQKEVCHALGTLMTSGVEGAIQEYVADNNCSWERGSSGTLKT